MLSLMIEDFGGRLASVWSELRPTTRGLVERALQSPNIAPADFACNSRIHLTMRARITN